MQINIEFYASLMKYLPPGKSRFRREVKAEDGLLLASLIEQFHIPPQMAHIVLVNGHFVEVELRAERVLVIASTARHSAQNIAFHEVGRQAIMADPAWANGDYYGNEGNGPEAGLSVARMAAHITYLSEEGLTEKFGRRLQDRDSKSFGFDADFQVESYLRYQGSGFTQRFDANSYLYITRAMDYFDLAEEHGGKLADAFGETSARFCVISFDSDWLYPTAESRHVVHALNAAGAKVSFVELSAPHGHDSFLLEHEQLDRVMKGFING